MNPSVVVITTGTSVLRDGASEEERKILNRTANKKESDLSPEEKSIIDGIAKRQGTLLLQCSIEEARNMSAELNGVLGLYRSSPEEGKNNIHFLLRSDTYQGAKAAEIISEWMHHKGLNTQSENFPGLNTSSIADFTSAMSDLVKWCDQILPGYSRKGYRVVFCLVGGFKSFQGFMQALGMFYADESVYIYENSDELLRLPRLPVDLESSFASVIKKKHHIVRRMLYKDIPVSECEGIPEIMLLEVDGFCSLSPWGDLIFNKFKEKYYSSEILLPPPSAKIKIKEKALEHISKDAARVRDFNERLDDLARFLETQQNIKRLDFKKLKGNPIPPCTHEADLSADKGAWRIFGYFEDECFVIHHVGESDLH
ncbi:CRISPR-associated protein, APE2256 family [Thermovirga lienii DSM 17291]|uniref:CRISPR-associated protein, APE2256 family n=1 Tax=Thermovirga lienii (strain ATCC BAA-1197 / DSM 17291 / Cas60314) TaxID=580340 RepID=G7V6E3_THELD|nr:putative CRISPR-associated protein [Thermovirga lienii]AER65972.1 CRISPR-associated protein, APE2256 family [Thermovirga lienii DSM 17291]